MIQPGNWQGIGVTPMSFGRQTVKVSHPPCHLRHLEVRLLAILVFWGDGKILGHCNLRMSEFRGIPKHSNSMFNQKIKLRDPPISGHSQIKI